jgi:hypothetical protein
MHNLGAWGYFVELIIGPWGEDGEWQGLAPLFPDGARSPKDTPAGALSAFEAAVLEEVIAEVGSAEFLADLLVFEPGKPDPRICTEAGWAACGFDRFLHGPH